MGKPQLIVCGSIAIDRIMNFGGRYRDIIQPDKLHVLSVSVLLDELEASPGGNGANITSAIAQLGEKPQLVGSAGVDAKDYLERLAGLGVDTSHVHVSQLPTASFNVITDSEDNQVGGFYQGAMSDSESLTLAPWQGQDVVVLQAPHNPAAMNRLVAECQLYKLRLLYDPGQQITNADTDVAAGVQAAEVLFVNDYELSLLTERLRVAPAELKARLPIMVTTLGKEGSLIEGQSVKQPLKIGIAPPERVVDPTGAGDAYRAGFLYGYLRQWELQKCGQLGATLASFIVEQHGAQRQLDLSAIRQRYQTAFHEELEL